MATFSPELTYLCAKDAVEFYEKAFGGVVESGSPMKNDKGQYFFCAVRLPNNARIICFDYAVKKAVYGEEDDGVGQGSRVTMFLNFPEPSAVEAFWKTATENGATVHTELKVGAHTYGALNDPFGYTWSVGVLPDNPSEPEAKKACKESAATAGDSQ
eukprot:m.58319 g.58319  ORF g.58319 m.58319 type:complete len:157 (-) comp11680_c0_seq1:278-748(-)